MMKSISNKLASLLLTAGAWAGSVAFTAAHASQILGRIRLILAFEYQPYPPWPLPWYLLGASGGAVKFSVSLACIFVNPFFYVKEEILNQFNIRLATWFYIFVNSAIFAGKQRNGTVSRF